MTIDNRYHVKQEGKRSHLCCTYICNDLTANETVLLKILNISSDRKDTASELFQREVKALEILHHPNIIRYLSSGFDNTGNPYITMEYVYSQNLFEYISNEAVDVEGKFDIAIKILDGLIHSHDKDVVHRDIKPQNILINIDNEIKIVDYGISKIIGAAYDPSETLKDYMSVKYAAPEQLLRKEVTILSDLYSFGLVLAFLFTETEPPEERTQLDTYIGQIKFSGIAKLVDYLTNADVTLRPQSGHKD